MAGSSLHKERSGFSLIELLIVVTILAVLIALLLPAVQKIREASARLQCSARLRQLALASLQAHDMSGSLPPGIGYFPAHSFAYGTYFFHLLPYLEQEALYQRSEHNGYFFVGNHQVYSQPLAAVLCPSDPSVPASRTAHDLVGNVWGVSCYAVNAQVACRVNAEGEIQSPAFYAVLPNNISDGTSNTILLTERYAQCFNQSYPTGGTFWAYYFTGPNLQAFHPGIEISWNGYSTGPASKFQTQPHPYNGSCDPTMASSPHRGGIQIALADGSVRFLSSNITMYTWWYLCTPNGGEEISAHAY